MKWYAGIIIALFIGFLLPSAGGARATVNPGEGLVLANDFVQLKFEPEGMGLEAMIDLKTGYNHIRSVEGKHLLWEIAFGKGTQIQRITNNYKPCNYAAIENLPDGTQRAIMEWNELRWWEEDSVVTVQVVVDLPKDCGVAEWRIFVENLSDYWGLWEATCPKVNGFPEPGVYDIARPTFASGGHLLKKCENNVRGRYPSGGWPMQFMSFNDGTNAVYFASRDPDARGKDFSADASKGELAMVHYPENMGIAGSDYPDYYAVAFGVYQGGWLEAAHRYRPWALAQKWSQAGPISKRDDIAPIVKDVGLWTSDSWVWNGAEGTPHEMNVPFLDAQKAMGVPMAIHWYNWHHMTFDNQYPYFLPPKPGFTERVKELVDAGFLIMPYINGTSADLNIPNWDEFAPHAILDEGGGFKMHFYWDGAGRLLSMCPSREFWQDKISVLVDSLLGYHGCNGVYIDQISAMSHELCYNADHGHPVGGGRYWADGNRDLLRKVHNVSHRKGRQFVITSEGADEIFFDLLDANLTWAEPTDWEIPMMFVVYSGYTVFFGSRCDYTRSDRFFNFAQGQAYIDGRQNGWMGFGLFKPEYAEKAAYFRQCGQYRVATKDFLNYGRLWGPVTPVNEVPTFTEDGFGWNTKHTGTVPCAEARLWQAEDGRLGIFMANYVNAQVPFAFAIDPAEYGLPNGDYRLTEITPEGKIPIRTVTGAIERTETLEPRKLKVIEIAPAVN